MGLDSLDGTKKIRAYSEILQIFHINNVEKLY